MKKVYIAPQTEAIEVIANSVLMVSPGGGFELPYGPSGQGGSPR